MTGACLPAFALVKIRISTVFVYEYLVVFHREAVDSAQKTLLLLGPQNRAAADIL